MKKAKAAVLEADRRRIVNRRIICTYSLCVSLFFLIASPIAVIYTKEWNFFENLWHIIRSPCPLITDYFALGGLGSTLFNAAVCGLLANLIILIFKVRANATTLAGYMLIVAHCFYGLNFLNMWPPFIGVLLYCKVMKKKISENIHIAFFATALAPFISEYNKTAVQYKKIGITKVRKEEFPKNTLRKILRFKIDKRID